MLPRYSEGPWETSDGKWNNGRPTIFAKDGKIIVNFAIDEDDNAPEVWANAFLVAAAPELYEQLKQAQTQLCSCTAEHLCPICTLLLKAHGFGPTRR